MYPFNLFSLVGPFVLFFMIVSEVSSFLTFTDIVLRPVPMHNELVTTNSDIFRRTRWRGNGPSWVECSWLHYLYFGNFKKYCTNYLFVLLLQSSWKYVGYKDTVFVLSLYCLALLKTWKVTLHVELLPLPSQSQGGTARKHERWAITLPCENRRQPKMSETGVPVATCLGRQMCCSWALFGRTIIITVGLTVSGDGCWSVVPRHGGV